jgi:hypothetical protein
MGNYHLAILKKPYLDAFLRGVKTVEFRFSKTSFYASIGISAGDTVFLKESSGPVCAEATVSRVEYYRNVQPEDMLRIKELYNMQIGADEQYWQSKMGSRFGFLAWLTNIKSIEPVRICKKDWRAWVVLSDRENFGLLANK